MNWPENSRFEGYVYAALLSRLTSDRCVGQGHRTDNPLILPVIPATAYIAAAAAMPTQVVHDFVDVEVRLCR